MAVWTVLLRGISLIDKAEVGSCLIIMLVVRSLTYKLTYIVERGRIRAVVVLEKVPGDGRVVYVLGTDGSCQSGADYKRPHDQGG